MNKKRTYRKAAKALFKENQELRKALARKLGDDVEQMFGRLQAQVEPPGGAVAGMGRVFQAIREGAEEPHPGDRPHREAPASDLDAVVTELHHARRETQRVASRLDEAIGQIDHHQREEED